MVEVVFAKVVLRQIRDIRELHMWNVRRLQHPDIHLKKLLLLRHWRCCYGAIDHGELCGRGEG